MSRTRRHLAVLATAALGLTAAAAVTPAAAAPAPATGSTTVTMFLKAPNPAALDRLANAHGLSHAQRVKAVSALVPSEATHRQIANTLRAQGFRVTSETSWSITATGAKATAEALFGTRPTLGKHPSLADRAAATGPLSRVPASLSGAVSAVFPTTGGPKVFHHATATSTLNGTDFRNADTPANVTPSTGANTTGATVATLQLADFFGLGTGAANSTAASDLTHYATDHSLADPVANGHYKAVRIDGGPSASDDTGGGDIEVNLDQESILSTAPSANQHAYFAPNTDAGFNDVFANVYDDVVGNSHATAKDPHIIALSSSWGACEAANTPAAITALEPILKSLVAAGVTVFASSGDDGIYDCGSANGTGTDNSAPAVDYPASSPEVVGVGGTNLSAAAGTAPNTGSNWVEKTWSCTTPVSCQNQTTGTGGGGGGASTLFAAPSYQQVGIDDAPFKGKTKRLVPDIAADADPSTGFVLYTSDLLQSGGQNNIPVGGTSLASPISAAQLANALADSGRKTGVGDIHGALYSAYRRTKSYSTANHLRAFRDVTVGTNGATANKGTNPSVSAQVGYDTNSGLGGVLWSALVPYLVDAHKPITSAALSEPHPHTSAYRQITAKWNVTRGADTSLLAPTVVRLTAAGHTYASSSSLIASGNKTFSVPAGKTYQLTVTGTDISGRRSSATKSVRLPLDDSGFSFSKGWHRVKNANDVAGSHVATAIKGSTAKASGAGRTFALQVLTSKASGRIGVYLGKTLVKRLNLHSSSVGRHTFLLASTTARHNRTFTFKVLDKKPVTIDALVVTY